MSKPRITAYKNRGLWNTYYGSLPDTVQAVIVHENLTLDELKEHFPDLYEQAIKQIEKTKNRRAK